MKSIPLSKELGLMSDYELYSYARCLLIRECAGYSYILAKCDLVETECRKRNSKIFEYALQDAITTINSSEGIMDGLRVIDIKRIDFMSDAELTEFLETVGAARRHDSPDETKPDVTDIYSLVGIKKENLFFCRVSGVSMADADIADGDMILVDSGSQPADGNVVVVRVNGSLLVKRLRLIDGALWLVSDNENFPPVKITEDMEYTVFGVVRHRISKIS